MGIIAIGVIVMLFRRTTFIHILLSASATFLMKYFATTLSFDLIWKVACFDEVTVPVLFSLFFDKHIGINHFQLNNTVTVCTEIYFLE